jgi:hypothetical protein
MSLPGDLEKMILIERYRQQRIDSQRQTLAHAYGPIHIPVIRLVRRVSGWLRHHGQTDDRPTRPQVQHRRRFGW